MLSAGALSCFIYISISEMQQTTILIRWQWRNMEKHYRRIQKHVHIYCVIFHEDHRRPRNVIMSTQLSRSWDVSWHCRVPKRCKCQSRCTASIANAWVVAFNIMAKMDQTWQSRNSQVCRAGADSDKVYVSVYIVFKMHQHAGRECVWASVSPCHKKDSWSQKSLLIF